MTTFYEVRAPNAMDSQRTIPARASVVSRFHRMVVLVATGLALFGCAVIPPATVNLSADVGQDVLAIKKSHLYYLNGYYDRLESEANRFIDQEYTPILIRTALNGKTGVLLMQKLETGKSGDQAAQDSVAFMQRFLADVKNLVDAQRTKVSASIEGARRQALTQVDAAYSQVAQGNATLTAYLESLVKVHTAQNELLATAGVPNLQDDIAEKLANASDTAANVLAQASAGDKSLDDVHKSLEDLKNAVTNKK
jgi:hypothetical protein